MAPFYEDVWENCLHIIKDNVPPQSFKTWFEPIKPVKLEGKILTIQVPSLFFYEWLEEHYVVLLKKTIKKELGTGAKLEYNIIVDNSSSHNKPYTINMPAPQTKNNNGIEVSMPVNIGSSIKNPFIIPGLKKVNIDSQLNQNLTFDNYIEGDCNKLARAAGLAVAARPGNNSFNPLVIFGGVGLGKSHLVQAIGNQLKLQHKNKIILYVPSEKFTNQFFDAIKTSSANDFINFYQMIDVLIIDDIQFFANKEKTQEILFHIFNHLHQNGKQLIFTSDRAPKNLQGLMDRLHSRFMVGLCADLNLPDFETRMAILENKMHSNGIDLPRDVVEYVAYNITTNVRELEGALNCLLANASLAKRDIDLQMCREILRNFIKNSSRELTIEHIQNLVCEHCSVEPDLLKSKTRKRDIVQVRHMCMYLAKQFTKESLARIGKFFGGRDHSTVIHACQAVLNQIDTDKEFRSRMAELQKKINNNLG